VHLVENVDEKRLEQLAVECARLGARAVFHGCCLGHGPEDFGTTAQRVISREGVIDALVLDSADLDRCRPFLVWMTAQARASQLVVIHRGPTAVAQQILRELATTRVAVTVVNMSTERDGGIGPRLAQRLERSLRGAA
jgi:hypothetical protein